MRDLNQIELLGVAGGHGDCCNHNNHHNNNDNNNNQVKHPPHDHLDDAIDRLNIIKNGLTNGDSWETIGKNISKHFHEKYDFVDQNGR